MNWIKKETGELLFISSFFTSSVKFSEFDAGNVILFQIKVFSRNIKETMLWYFIKVNARPSFTPLRIIRQIKEIHQKSKEKIPYSDSFVSFKPPCSMQSHTNTL